MVIATIMNDKWRRYFIFPAVNNDGKKYSVFKNIRTWSSTTRNLLDFKSWRGWLVRKDDLCRLFVKGTVICFQRPGEILNQCYIKKVYLYVFRICERRMSSGMILNITLRITYNDADLTCITIISWHFPFN